MSDYSALTQLSLLRIPVTQSLLQFNITICVEKQSLICIPVCCHGKIYI